MIFNTGHSFGSFIEPPTQEEIYKCPEYFAMSKEAVMSHDKCTPALRRILERFPWTGRPSVLQKRPQDFRNGKPNLLGDHWHVDANVRLNDGVIRTSTGWKDFSLMVISFGDVTETEFISEPIEHPDTKIEEFDHSKFFTTKIFNKNWRIKKAKPNQMALYTSIDIHRIGPNIRNNQLRLMIVAFESDTVPSGGWCLPSIQERELGNNPDFWKYNK